MNSYVINRKTMAIIALNEKQSLVYELGKQVVVNKTPLFIVKKSCYVFGSSFTGRIEGARNLIGYRYKTPIVIQEADEIVLFPTKSPKLDTEWISINHVESFYPNEDDKNNTFVEFDNGLIMEFNVSYYIFKNQFMKASCLVNLIKKNK